MNKLLKSNSYLILITSILSSITFISTILFVFAAEPRPDLSDSTSCSYEYHKGTDKLKWAQCCTTSYDHDGNAQSPYCKVSCYNKSGKHVDCSKVLMEGTFNPNITNGATGGVLIDRGTTGSSNETTNTTLGLSRNKGKVIDNTFNSNIIPNGVKDPVSNSSSDKTAQYVGDPSTWCKRDPTDPSGKMTCTCKGGSTDCLHMCQFIDCPFGCIGSSADCKVELPAASSNSNDGALGKTKTQGTLSPSFKAGGAAGNIDNPNSTTGGASPYINDPSTWCKVGDDGIIRCTCVPNTIDCLHLEMCRKSGACPAEPPASAK